MTNLLPGGEQIIMAPQEKIFLWGDRLAYEEAGDQNDVLWTEGILSLEGISFERLLRKLEKYYDYRIEVERSEMPRIRIVRGKIKLTDGIDHALKVLQMASDFNYEKQEDNRLIIIK
ncbi:MAG: DUF4974 domain-containing protein [Rikenellaceae bacterium]|nr:DUF4974 domain-containing protein [Rikenellaceae bacterium]